jgi:hypothetical protein
MGVAKRSRCKRGRCANNGKPIKLKPLQLQTRTDLQMAKTFTYTATAALPEGGDAISHAKVVTALAGAVDAFKAAIPEGVTVTHDTALKTPKGPTGPRKPKAPPAA